jgi:hypothetical protein
MASTFVGLWTVDMDWEKGEECGIDGTGRVKIRHK